MREIGLVATVAFARSAAAAVENARELAGYCQSLERSARGAGRHIYIPRTRETLTCWGYMQAMQDLSVLADEDEHRIMGGSSCISPRRQSAGARHSRDEWFKKCSRRDSDLSSAQECPLSGQVLKQLFGRSADALTNFFANAEIVLRHFQN